MRKYILMAIFISILSVYAQANFSMEMRLRSEMENLNSSNADKQVYNREADLRLRPGIDYKVNDYLTVKAVLEIGDIQYGSNGGAVGTDGKNLKTKNIYMDVMPTKNHLFRIGLLPYKDAHSMIIDSDLAGIMWNGLFNKYSVKVGWFAAEDRGEEYIDESSYSFGTSVFLADMDYKLNKMFTLGVNNVFILSRDGYGTAVRRDGVSIFFAPRVQANIGLFHVDAQFVANNNYATYTPYEPGPGYNLPWDPDKTGLGLSIKSSFKMDDQTTFRANLLFRGCYENWENYEAFSSDYDTGLEIINENANGISTHNPMNEFTSANGFQLGVVVPSLFVDWKYTDNVTFTGGFGFIMNDQDYELKVDVSDPLESVNDDMFIAWELDLKAKVTLYDEQIQFYPYLALFVPTDKYAYNKVDNTGSPINFTDDLEPATDMQLKLGTTVKYNF